MQMNKENCSTFEPFLGDRPEDMYEELPACHYAGKVVDVKAARCFAYLVMKGGGIDQAAWLVRELIDRDPLGVENHILLVDILRRGDRAPQPVIDACRFGLEHHPDNLDLKQAFIEALLRRDSLGEAMIKARGAAEEYPNSPRPHAWLATTLRSLAKKLSDAEALPLYEREVNEWRIVLEADPSFPNAYSRAAEALDKLGRTEEAREFRSKDEEMVDDEPLEDPEQALFDASHMVSEVFKNEQRPLSEGDLVEALLD